MKKTSLYIDEEIDAGLARRAAAEGVSKAEVIRRALREAAVRAPRLKPFGRGIIKDGPPNLSTSLDDGTDETFGTV